METAFPQVHLLTQGKEALVEFPHGHPLTEVNAMHFNEIECLCCLKSTWGPQRFLHMYEIINAFLHSHEPEQEENIKIATLDSIFTVMNSNDGMDQSGHAGERR